MKFHLVGCMKDEVYSENGIDGNVERRKSEKI